MSDAQDFGAGASQQAGYNRQSDREWFGRWVREGANRTAEMFTPPPAAGEHFREARIEFWRGVRELVDSRIRNLSRKSEPKGTTVVVE